MRSNTTQKQQRGETNDTNEILNRKEGESRWTRPTN
jgi:hypothetical protein